MSRRPLDICLGIVPGARSGLTSLVVTFLFAIEAVVLVLFGSFRVSSAIRVDVSSRMIDLVASTVEGFSDSDMAAFKRRAFLAVLDEEAGRLTADPALIDRIRGEVLAG